MINEKPRTTSEIKIRIETKFKRFTLKDFDEDDSENITKEIEESFHDTVHKYIEEKIIEDDEDLQARILELMDDENNLPKKVKDFNGFGNISIHISQNKKR